MAGHFRFRLQSSQVQRIIVQPHRCSSELEDTSDDEGDHSVNDDSSKLITSDDNGNHLVNDDYSKLIESSALHISEATIASNKPDIAANARSATSLSEEDHSVNDDSSSLSASTGSSSNILSTSKVNKHTLKATIASNISEISANTKLAKSTNDSRWTA